MNVFTSVLQREESGAACLRQGGGNPVLQIVQLQYVTQQHSRARCTAWLKQERQDRLTALRAELAQPVSGLEELRTVLRVIRAVTAGALQWDLECSDLQERFR